MKQSYLTAQQALDAILSGKTVTDSFGQNYKYYPAENQIGHDQDLGDGDWDYVYETPEEFLDEFTGQEWNFQFYIS